MSDGTTPWTRRLAWRLFPLMPEPMLRASLGWERPTSAPSEHTLPRFDAAHRRLLVGPVNTAGQAREWARAVRVHVPGATALSMALSEGTELLDGSADIEVPLDLYLFSRRWQRAALRDVSESATHVLIESMRPLFGHGIPGGAAREVPLLRRRGVAPALVFHGSDIRDGERHAATSSWSPYRDADWADAPALRERAARNRRVADDLGTPVFVSTPDLLDEVAGARWLPVVVEPAFFDPLPQREPARVLRVVHAPSSQLVKGTHLIEPVLRQLEHEGLIDYRRLENVSHDAMPGLYRQADVMLDQFRIGSYGVAAAEALAEGCVVVGHIADEVRETVREQTGRALPIVQATPGTLADALRALAGDRTRVAELEREGAAFARAVHDGSHSARVLAPFLGAVTG